ncbi:methionine--tRNA ligase [Patescibacteria group bacterium]
MNKNFYVTTTIYYANGSPHIGHYLTNTVADVLARYKRLEIGSNNVFFTTGLDEHGTTVEQSASKEGFKNKDIQKYVDKRAVEWKKAFDDSEISYDYFVRTTDPMHEEHAKNFIRELVKSKDVYKSTYAGKYCNGCEKFLTLSDQNEKGLCPLHRPDQVIETKEDNYFFKLSRYAPKVKKLVENGKLNVQPQNKKREILSRLSEKIDDVSISRPKEKVGWGIEFPDDPKQSVYVWVEALMNYTSSLEINNKEDFWKNSYHVIGKDISWFHNVIWPALLLSAGKPLFTGSFVHSFLNIGGEKISKSKGNVITPSELIAKYGIDGARYLILSNLPYKNDSDVTWEYLDVKYNADLANGLGNLVSRIVGLTNKYFNSVIPESPKDPEKHPLRVGRNIHTWKKAWEDINKSMDTYEFNKALGSIWKFIAEADKYINDQKPWELAKDGNEKELAWVVYGLCDSVHQLAWQLGAFLPDTSTKIANSFNIKKLLVKQPNKNDGWTNIKPGTKLKTLKPLFPRLEEK